MAVEVAALEARLTADIRNFERGMRRAERRLDKFDTETGKTTKSVGRLERGIGGTGLTMRTVFAGAAAAATFQFMKDSVRASSDLTESMNALEKTFGPAADGLKRIGDTSAESFGLAQSQFNQFAVRFSAFAKKIAGPGGDVVQVVEDITQRVADFASVQNLEVAESAQIIQSALAGETEAFRRFGGDVSAAAVKAKALELGLADVSSELTEQDKILARYELIMEQTANTAGDFADTSDDLANKQRIFQAKLEDTKATIGEDLLPVMTEFLDIGVELLPVLAETAEGIVAILKGIKPLLQGVGWLIGKYNDLRTTAEELADSDDPLERFAGAFAEIFTSGALPWLIGKYEEFAQAQRDAERGFSGVQAAADNTRAVLGDKYRRAAEDAADATDDLAEAARNAEGPTLTLEEALARNLHPAMFRARQETLRLKDAFDELNDRFRQVDPALAALDAMERWIETQGRMNEAIEQFGASSDEAEQAGRDVLTAYGDLISAAEEYATQSGQSIIDSIRRLGEEAKLPAEVIQSIIDALGELDGFVATATVDVNMPSTALRSFNVPAFHDGGVVPGPVGQERLALLEAGETVLPARKPPPTRAGPLVVNVQVDSRTLASAVVEADELNRRLGVS